MSNPLLNITPKNLKNLCFGCEKCKDDPFDVFICTQFVTCVWVRNYKYGIYLTRYATHESLCGRSTYKLGPTDIRMESYEQLIEIANSRFPNWLE